MSDTPAPERITCPNCGALNDPAATQCTTCGWWLRVPGDTAGPQPSGSQAPAPEAARQSPYEYAGAVAPGSPVPDRPPDYHATTGQPSDPAQSFPYPYPANTPGAPPQQDYGQSYQPTLGAGQPPGYPAATWAQPAAAPRRNNAPLIALAAGVPLLLCLCSVLVLTLVRTPTFSIFAAPTATPLEAGAILDQAATVMDQVQTVHYRMLGEFSNLGSTKDFSVNLEGDIDFPDSYTMHSDSSGDVIVIGPDAWLRSPDSQRWLEAKAQQAGSATTNPATLARFVRYHRSAILESDYLSGTQRLYRLNFTIDTLAMAAGEGEGSAGETLLGTDSDADALIDAATNRVQELVLRVTDANNANLQLRIQFSDFDKTLTIKPPSDLGP